MQTVRQQQSSHKARGRQLTNQFTPQQHLPHASAWHSRASTPTTKGPTLSSKQARTHTQQTTRIHHARQRNAATPQELGQRPMERLMGSVQRNNDGDDSVTMKCIAAKRNAMQQRHRNKDEETTNDERRTTNGERRTTNGERRTANGERRTTQQRTTNDETQSQQTQRKVNERTTNDERRTTNNRTNERSNDRTNERTIELRNCSLRCRRSPFVHCSLFTVRSLKRTNERTDERQFHSNHSTFAVAAVVVVVERLCCDERTQWTNEVGGRRRRRLLRRVGLFVCLYVACGVEMD